MVVDLLAPGGTRLFGHLHVSRAANGNLAGQITLGTRSYPTSWRKFSTA
jgi:hypothetical protein